MSEEKKEYVIHLDNEKDYDSFCKEMCHESNCEYTPDRCVHICNHRPGSENQVHFDLTDSEAKELLKDNRVKTLSITPEQNKLGGPRILGHQFGGKPHGFSTCPDWYHGHFQRTFNLSRSQTGSGATSGINSFRAGITAIKYSQPTSGMAPWNSITSGYNDYAKIMHSTKAVNRHQHALALTGYPRFWQYSKVVSGSILSATATSALISDTWGCNEGIVIQKKGDGSGHFANPLSSVSPKKHGAVPTTYNYSMNGKGVDVIIQDTGVDYKHPDFRDQNGNSRVQTINWFHSSAIGPATSAYRTSNGSLCAMPSGFYKDFSGHGTHVAGTVAGRQFGWAKEASIYSMKILSPHAGCPTMPLYDSYDLMRLWHRNKPIDPETGYKRPTVINASWGWSFYYLNGDGKSFMPGWNRCNTPLSGKSSRNSIFYERLRNVSLSSTNAGSATINNFLPITGTLARGPLSSLAPTGITQTHPLSDSRNEFRRVMTMHENRGSYGSFHASYGNGDLQSLSYVSTLGRILEAVPVYMGPRSHSASRVTNITFSGVTYYDKISGNIIPGYSHVLSSPTSGTQLVSLPVSSWYNSPIHNDTVGGSGSSVIPITGVGAGYHSDDSTGRASVPWSNFTGWDIKRSLGRYYDLGGARQPDGSTSEISLFISLYGSKIKTGSFIGNNPYNSITSYGVNETRAITVPHHGEIKNGFHGGITFGQISRIGIDDENVGKLLDEGVHFVKAAGNDSTYIASTDHPNWGNVIGLVPSARPNPNYENTPVSGTSLSGANLHLASFADRDGQHYSRGASPGDRTTDGLKQRNITVGAIDQNTVKDRMIWSGYGLNQLHVMSGFLPTHTATKYDADGIPKHRRPRVTNITPSASGYSNSPLSAHYTVDKFYKYRWLFNEPWKLESKTNGQRGVHVANHEYYRPTMGGIVSGALFQNPSSNISGAIFAPANFSNYGAGCDIWAAGTFIRSCATTYYNPLNNSHRYPGQNRFTHTSAGTRVLQGTSMASPQVAGVLACYLQAHPEYTVEQAKQAILSDAVTGVMLNGGRLDSIFDRNYDNHNYKYLMSGNFSHHAVDDGKFPRFYPLSGPKPEPEGRNTFRDTRFSTLVVAGVNIKDNSKSRVLFNRYNSSDSFVITGSVISGITGLTKVPIEEYVSGTVAGTTSIATVSYTASGIPTSATSAVDLPSFTAYASAHSDVTNQNIWINTYYRAY